MSIDEELQTTLMTLGVPVKNAVFLGDDEGAPCEKEYITFNYSTIGEDYADDAPQYEKYLVQVHIFAPLKVNTTKRVRAAKRALAAADYTWPETINASDSHGRHIVLECEKVSGGDLYGEV